MHTFDLTCVDDAWCLHVPSFLALMLLLLVETIDKDNQKAFKGNKTTCPLITFITYIS